MPKLIENDPLAETDAILENEFYRGRTRPLAEGTGQLAKPKPTHYKIVCISLYNQDIARLEALVAELKRRGHTKANKSAIIRFALDNIDINKMPKGY
jgi:hypothetical protein